MSPVLTALKLVPKNALSRAVGATLRAPWPRPIVRMGIRGFSRAYGVQTDESEHDYLSYRTFNDFFTRRLKSGLRPLAPGENVVACPVDGAVGQIGDIVGGRLVQAKGRDFTLGELLVDQDDARDYEGGTFATLYLAPYNYHRIHAPVAGRISGYSYVPGHLWPVNTQGVARIDRLFAVNERLITHLDGEAGKVAVIKVGATCVGRIRVSYDDVVTNNGGERSFRRMRYESPFDVERGGEVGVFEMGSTVIVLFQKGRATFEPGLAPGDTVRVGQALAKLAPRK